MLVVFFLRLLFACSADFLNIPIPSRGIHSVHQEDLKRDIWAIEQGYSAQIWWEKRISQLEGEMLAQENASCLYHRGENEKGILYWTMQKNDAGIQVGVLLSLAKASDQISREQSYQYCLGKPDVREGWIVQEIGNIDGEQLEIRDNIWNARWDKKQSFGQINFERLQQNIQTIIASNSPSLVEASNPSIPSLIPLVPL